MNSLYRFLPAAVCLFLAAPSFSPAQSGNYRADFVAETNVDTTIDVEVAAKWNMVSVPLVAADMHKDTLFPSSLSSAYTWAAGYSTEDTLEVGKGYWLKFAGAETIPLFGSVIHKDTFDVVAGWNMVGSVSNPVPAGSISTIPPGILVSDFWEFNQGYDQASAILPGEGYWVKTSSPGAIVLDDALAAAPERAVDPFSGLHTLVIEDSRGMTQTLRFGEAATRSAGAFTEMPPPPPAGIFDARFADGNWVELYAGGGGHAFAVNVTSAAWPVTVRWDMNARDGNEIVLNESVRMTGKGFVVIEGEGPISVRAGVSGVPAAYNLRQNYPNPFNPVTTITYELPVNAAVRLTVYDLLGREIAVLADGMLNAGVHDVVFDAAGYTSGVYFYRLEAGSFVSSRKLMIMK